MAKGPESLPPLLAIVTDIGKASREQGNCIVKEAVVALMSFWESPFRPAQDPLYSSLLEAPGPAVADWVVSEAYTAQMSSLFLVSEANKVRRDEGRRVCSVMGGGECARQGEGRSVLGGMRGGVCAAR